MKREVYATDNYILENYKNDFEFYTRDDSVMSDDMDSVYLVGADDLYENDEELNELGYTLIGIDDSDNGFVIDEDIKEKVANILRQKVFNLSKYVKMNQLCELADVPVDSYKRADRLTPETRISIYEKLIDAIKSLGN